MITKLTFTLLCNKYIHMEVDNLSHPSTGRQEMLTVLVEKDSIPLQSRFAESDGFFVSEFTIC